MRTSPMRWKALAGVAFTLTLAGPPDISAARERSPGSHAGGRVSTDHGRVYRPHHQHHGGSYYRHYGWPYYGYYGGYGYGGYYGYGGWSGYPYPYPYPVLVQGESVADRPGAVETDVRPGRANVLVDGKLAGQARDFSGTWDVLWLSPGSHELEFSRDGYQTLRVRVDVDGGSYYRIHQRLNRGAGLDPRSHALTAAPDTEEGVRPQGGVRATAAPDTGDSAPALAVGFLTLDVSPADAAVYLDGEFLANGGELARLHGALPVAPGEHIVEVVRPGYRSVKQRVTVEAGEPATVTIRLERMGGST